MKSVRFLLPLLLLLCTFSLCGCTSKEEKKIEDAVKQELDQLKDLDSITTQKYISYQELFPGEPEDITISSDIEEVFSLFFQDFDYKILDVNVDKDKQSAQANLRLVTLDAHALAEDFSKAQLKHEISQSASSEEATEQTISLEERYTLLNELLKSNDYQTVERNCTISLDASNKDGETSWEIRRTNTLENDLVGGLMNDLTDPDILSPEDTILVYLNTLKNMSAEELGNYLNADSIISTEDPARISFITFHAKSNVILNLALVPLSTKESDKSRCFASARESSEFLNDSNLLINFSSILFYILQQQLILTSIKINQINCVQCWNLF